MSTIPVPTHLRTVTYHGLKSGPCLLVLGAVHGHETCGTSAITQILAEIDNGALAVERGTLTFLPVANPLAYQLRQRNGERNLNRKLAPSAVPQDFEDRVANVLCPLLDKHDVLLDLHSFYASPTPFVMIGPPINRGELEPFSRADEEMRLALHSGPYRIVEGWLDTFTRGLQRRQARAGKSGGSTADPGHGVGTCEYMRSRGGYAVMLECGQHDDPQAVQVARHAILQTLALLEISPVPLAPLPAEREILRVVDVTDRDHAGDRFSRDWCSFDAIEAGEVIGMRHGGAEIRAPADGFVMFPNPNAEVGQEWFYFARRQPQGERQSLRIQ